MKKELVSKVLIRRVMDYSRDNQVDLNVALIKVTKERNTFAEDVIKETEKYIHENYKAICAAYAVNSELTEYTI